MVRSFSCGDGHAAQGDGEACVTAIKAALQVTFRLIVREDMNLAYPVPKRRPT